MKKQLYTILVYSILFISPFLLSGCLITDVAQSTSVNQGDTFTAVITASDVTADANPNVGAVAVLVPEDWEFASGTYDSEAGVGNLIIDTNTVAVYGDLEGKLPPPVNMKWVRLLSDAAYTNEANVNHEATVNFTVGSLSGTFEIGYMITKNAGGLLDALNETDEDSDAAWADTSMGYIVEVNSSTGVDDVIIPTDYSLEQNYPNPFNPTTNISFTLLKAENVKLTVYNTLGDEVAVIADNSFSAGRNTVTFNAASLSSGVYIYKIETSSFIQARKMILMK